jgi:hypothetical protein
VFPSTLFKRTSFLSLGFKHNGNGVGKPSRGSHIGRNDFLDSNKYDMTYFESDGSTKNVPSNERTHENNRDEILRNHDRDITYRNEYESKPNQRDFDSEFVQDQDEKQMSKNRAAFGNNQDDLYDNGKYDMTHFGKNDVDALSHEEESGKDIMNKNQDQISSDRNLDRSYRSGEGSGRIGEEILHHLERKRTSKHGKVGGDGLPPIGIPNLAIPDEVHFEHKQTRNLQPIETRSSKSTSEISGGKEDSGSNKRNQLPKNDESLDLDIEIKPLTVSDSKYFDEDKSKLSSIPKKPNRDSEVTQKIEHVRTNIVSKSASKKTKVGVLVGGKLDQAKADIVQNNSPDPTYDKVKDFFKSQQVSSIVDAPLAEKKEPVKLYNIPHEENVDVKRSSIPKPIIHPDRIRLDLKER